MRWTAALLVGLAACGPETTSPSDGHDGSAEGKDPDPSATDGVSQSSTMAPDDESGNDDDSTNACVPGQSIACTCTDGGSGAQVCAADGQSYEQCVCDDPDTVDDTTGTIDETTVAEESSSSADESTGGAFKCLSADEPLPDNVTIDSNDDIAQYAQYSVIAGSLEIEGPGVTSLVGFECLELIGSRLSLLGTTLLTDFTGLDNVQVVQGELEIGYNVALTSFVGLSSLSTVGYMSVYDSSLTSFAGLDSLTTIEDGFGASNNNDLATCAIAEFIAGLESPPDWVCYAGNVDDACVESCG